MRGKIKGFTDAGVNIFPVTKAEAVYMDKNMTVEQKIKEIENLMINETRLSSLQNVKVDNSKTWEVLQNIKGVWESANVGGNFNLNLKYWGVKLGFPTKPYTIADYKKADDNIESINKALLEAARLGYNRLTLPKGEYSVCYPRQIKIPSGMTLDLGGSTIKVMYESDVRSPYDTGSAAIHLFGGHVFLFAGVSNAHLTNGDIIGDVYERKWVTNEQLMEQTYGVHFSQGSTYCSVTKCDIHGFMGDNIAFSGGGIQQQGITTGSLRGDINDTTGAIIDGTETSTTMYTPAYAVNPKYKTFSMGGQGYSYLTGLNTKSFDVFYYDKDGTFIGVLKKRKPQSFVSIPLKATTYRLKFYNETDTAKNMEIMLHFGGDSHHNVVEHCEIYHGHRGGISLGGSSNVIQNNLIRDNGQLTSMMDGAPIFPDTTKYAINQEDSYGEFAVIRNNIIHGGYHGILIRAWGAIIEGNLFNYIGGSSVVLYQMDHARISGNYILTGTISSEGNTSLAGNVTITNNYIADGVSLYKNGYRVICNNNHLSGSLRIKDGSAHGNAITLTAAATIEVKHFKNNTVRTNLVSGLYDVSQNGGTSVGTEYVWENNTFNNINLVCNIQTAKFQYKGCTFTDSRIKTTNAPISLIETFVDCDFINTLINPTIATTTKIGVTVVAEKCRFTLTDATTFPQFVLMTVANSPEVALVRFRECTFTIESNLIKEVVKNANGFANPNILEFYDNKFIYKGLDSLLSLDLFPVGQTLKAYLDGNIFEKVNPKLTVDNTKIFYFNPSKASLTEPSTGYFQQGTKWGKGHATAGEFEGWIAVVGGWANNNAWVASVSYEVGTYLNTNNKVYLVKKAGTSGTAEPTHTTGNIANGTAEMEYIAPKAVFKPYGTIQT